MFINSNILRQHLNRLEMFFLGEHNGRILHNSASIYCRYRSYFYKRTNRARNRMCEKKLLKKHIKKATKGLTYSISDEISNICKTRVFFVRYLDYLVICGVYNVREKRDSIGEHTVIRHEVYDYLLFSQTDGFFFINGCSSPLTIADATKCISPSIYYVTNEARQLLVYGMTYCAEDLCHSYVVYNTVTYKSRDNREYEVSVFLNAQATMHLKAVTLFADLPSANGHFVYTREKAHMGSLVPSTLVNIFTSEQIPLLSQGGYSFSYRSDTTLSSIMLDFNSERLRISDTNNYYFYISKNHTFAYDAVMLCAEKFGSVKRLDNLFIEDASVNYQLSFPRDTFEDVISFVYGVISKSRALYPVILGCPIHDVVEVLCREEAKITRKPPHPIDELSARNIIDYIRQKFGALTNGEIVYLLCRTYGSYSVATQNSKYWMYYKCESLRCEYLPVSMASVIGEPINGNYVKNLEKISFDVKWKSERLLYQLIYFYYPDARLHYSAHWLGHQHLDIFVPSLMIGIEYQGVQHYEANDYFGGESGYEYRVFLDEQKKQLCEDNNVVLIEWPYSVPITAINLLKVLSECGIVNIPIPNPFNVPKITDDSTV